MSRRAHPLVPLMTWLLIGTWGEGGVRVPGSGNWGAPQLGRGLPVLTRATWTVNSTPMPTEAMRMTTGMALSLMPISPMMPNSSTAIMARMDTWGVGGGGGGCVCH